MHNGLLNVFDHSESAFVSAYRKHTTPEEFEIYVEYIAIPEMKGKIWIISDPMLATGNSMVAVYKALAKISKPSKIFIASAIATNEAIIFIKKHFIASVVFYTIGVTISSFYITKLV